jgi:hypothetical protein
MSGCREPASDLFHRHFFSLDSFFLSFIVLFFYQHASVRLYIRPAKRRYSRHAKIYAHFRYPTTHISTHHTCSFKLQRKRKKLLPLKLTYKQWFTVINMESVHEGLGVKMSKRFVSRKPYTVYRRFTTHNPLRLPPKHHKKK